MASRKPRKDRGRKRRPYNKRVVGMNSSKSKSTTNNSSTTEKYGQRGAYSQGEYSDRSPQEDAYRRRQLQIDEARIRRQKTSDVVNMFREGRGWVNSISSLGAFL